MKKLLKISTALFLMLPALLGTSCKDDNKGDEYPLLAAKSPVAQAGDAQVSVSWTAPASEYVKGYQLSWTPGNGSATVKDGTRYQATGLTNDTEYTFSIVAVYERGNADPVTIKATPKADAVIYEPCKMSVKAGDKFAKVSWIPPTPAGKTELTGYRISVSPADVEAIEITDPAATSQEIENLTNGKEYTFSVVVVYEGGESPATTAKATPETREYVACSNVKAKPDNRSIQLTWSVPEPAEGTELTGYRINVSPADVGAIEITDPKTTSRTIENLTNGKKYTFSVVAVYKRGESAAVTTTVIPGYADCRNVRIQASHQAIVLRWTEPEPVAGTELDNYTITYAPGDKSETVEAKYNTFLTDELPAGIEYTVTIYANYKDGGVSNGVSLKVTTVAFPRFNPEEITEKAIPAGWERLDTFNDKALPASIALYNVTKADGQTVNAYVVMWGRSARHKVYAEKTPTSYQTLRAKIGGEPAIVLAGTESSKSIVISDGQVILNREGEGVHKFKSGLSLNKDDSWSFGRMTTIDNVPYYYNDDIAQQTLWNAQEAFCSGNQYLDSNVDGGIVHETGMTDVPRSLSFVGYYHNAVKNTNIAALVICQEGGGFAGMSIESASRLLLSAGITDGCQVALDNSVGLEINGKTVFSCSNDLYYILSLSNISE